MCRRQLIVGGRAEQRQSRSDQASSVPLMWTQVYLYTEIRKEQRNTLRILLWCISVTTDVKSKISIKLL